MRASLVRPPPARAALRLTRPASASDTLGARDAVDTPLRIRLLGELELRLGDVALSPIESARAESLLAYLLLHRDAPQPRQRLAFVLWPDSTESQARTNLRHLLHRLRRALPEVERFLDLSPRTLGWRADAPYWLDVAAFEDALARAGDGDRPRAALEEAVELYTGDLLRSSYDDWLLEERERLREGFADALERLSALLEAEGRHAEAIRHAERLLRHDPLREATYRLLMRLHDARGDRGRALRAYHACAAALDAELGVVPSAPTREQYEALLPATPAPAESDGERIGGAALVGRGAERTRLTELWLASERGRAQLALVTGEPGIGKTRLVDELRSWCAHRGAVTAEARSYRAEGSLAYGPPVAWLRSDALAARRDRVDGRRRAELVRLLPELGSGPAPAEPDPLPADERRRRLYDALAGALLAPATPLLLVADDLHWADRETLQFLHYLLRTASGAPLLVAATARREELVDRDHPLRELLTALSALDRVTEIELGRLSREEAALLATRATGRELTPAGTDRLFAETEGNPLFVVEALRAGWTGDEREPPRVARRVQAVIEARLAQLSPAARDLVGVAATIGREFTADLLGAACDVDDDALVRGLDELWQRRIVRERGADAYDFSHDRIREVASAALSPARRRHHHLRVAEALQRAHARDPAATDAQIAWHLDRAGRAGEAIDWYEAAAAAAQRVHANREAIRLLDRALELAGTLAGRAERDRRELQLRIALLVPVAFLEGFASARLVGLQRRAAELAQAVGVPAAPPLLRSTALTSLSQDRYADARRVGRELRERGERDDDVVLIVEAEYVLGVSAFWEADLEAARTHLEAAVARSRPEHRSAHLARYGLDPEVVCRSRLANTLWFLGRPDAAIAARDGALALADRIGHAETRATALTFAALLCLDLGDEPGVRRLTGELQAFCGEHDSALHDATAAGLTGYVEVLDGDPASGLPRIRTAHDDALRGRRAPGQSACMTRVLLAACAAAGDAAAGLAATDPDGSAGVRLWDAERLRLRGVFLSALGAPPAEVAGPLERAVEVARGQGARALELRAATSLLRHRLEHGDDRGARAARARLVDVAGAVASGGPSPDRREAEAVLAGA